ncbi:hypothetical protein PsYK624_083910 [Phanerochaete sordida]|uniref:Uncharacterized protein n=1 Tax=Phanerochaete sordida TaxID=48140 RepID=A0A9P3GA59_9APHY|nr:hypothetical protein PsYK624_083910 [Phanerochaete sordida]
MSRRIADIAAALVSHSISASCLASDAAEVPASQIIVESSSTPGDSVPAGFIATGVIAGVAVVALAFFLVHRRASSRDSESSSVVSIEMVPPRGADASLLDGWRTEDRGHDQQTVWSLSRTSTVVPHSACAARETYAPVAAPTAQAAAVDSLVVGNERERFHTDGATTNLSIPEQAFPLPRRNTPSFDIETEDLTSLGARSGSEQAGSRLG